MEKKTRNRRTFDDQFRLSVLKEFYESGSSLRSICRKYGISDQHVHYWERKYREKSVSLPSEISELEKQVYMARSLKEARQGTQKPSVPKTREEELSEEVSRLRKALEYSELRNEALSEVLKIGKERYGLDLLKKTGAKQ